MWQTPELTVLVRNRPEEAVLAVCKDVGAGPNASVDACKGAEPWRSELQDTSANVQASS